MLKFKFGIKIKLQKHQIYYSIINVRRGSMFVDLAGNPRYKYMN